MPIVSACRPTHAYATANHKNEMDTVNIVFIVWAYAIFSLFLKYENGDGYCRVWGKNKLIKTLRYLWILFWYLIPSGEGILKCYLEGILM